MKIDFLIGENAYETTSHFAKGFARGLEACGVKCRSHWIGEGHFFHAFYSMLDDPPDLTCSFSDISMGGKGLGELWQIPHLSLLVDPPIYFLHQLRGDFSWISCVDQKDCSFVRSLGFKRTFFLPHGVDPLLRTDIRHERPYDVAFFGTCLDYEAIEKSWDPSVRETLQVASQRVLSPNGVSIVEALMELGVEAEKLSEYHDAVDQYTRGRDRVELIRSFQGAKVHVWGNGPWEKYLQDVEIYPSIPFEQTIQIMRRCKLVLNSSPRFKAGSHERIFYAFMCGACVFTGETVFMKENFSEIPTYRFGEWAQSHLNFEKLEEIADEGQKKIMTNHTYQSRAAMLLERVKASY